jgi:hypothetical protein
MGIARRDHSYPLGTPRRCDGSPRALPPAEGSACSSGARRRCAPSRSRAMCGPTPPGWCCMLRRRGSSSGGMRRYDRPCATPGPPQGYVLVPSAPLTIKGLEILNSVPDSIKDRTTLGEKVTEAAKSGVKRLSERLWVRLSVLPHERSFSQARRCPLCDPIRGQRPVEANPGPPPRCGARRTAERRSLLGLRRNAICHRVATARAWSVTREQ